MLCLPHRRSIVVRFCSLSLLLAIAFSLPGCGDSKPKRSVSRVPGGPVQPDDLVGVWKVAYVQIPREFDFCLIDISHKDKKYTVQLQGMEKYKDVLKLKSYEIKDNGDVRLAFDAGGLEWSFQGKLDGENIWGNLMLPRFQLAAAKLERTELTELDPNEEPREISALGQFLTAANSGDKFVELDQFVRQAHRSPLLIEAYGQLARHLKAEKIDLAGIKEFITRYRSAIEIWGSKIAPRVELEVGRALALQKYELPLAKELLDVADQKITADYPMEWRIQLADAWILMGEGEAALKIIKPLREENPSNPFVSMEYAQVMELMKDDEEALRLYAGLSVIPEFERMWNGREPGTAIVLPSEAAARLWKKKNGDTKGLDAFLKTAYEEQMDLYVPKHKMEARPANAQVALVELFTGSSCGPCVAADIAAESVSKAYSRNELIVLKFHEHAPLPDPLANFAGMVRFDAYKGQGTPTFMVNGQPLMGIAGGLLAAPSAVGRLQMVVDELLKKTTPVSLKLTGSRTDDQIEVEVTVKGIPKSDDDTRLFLVVAENEIDFDAPNGIRYHNFVARGTMGDVGGIKLKTGDSQLNQKTEIATLRAEITKHLKQFEDQSGKEFPHKPLEFGHLNVIGIVQNVRTMEYLQAAWLELKSPKTTPATATQPEAAEPKPVETPANKEKPDEGATEKSAEDKSPEAPAEEAESTEKGKPDPSAPTTEKPTE